MLRRSNTLCRLQAAAPSPARVPAAVKSKKKIESSPSSSRLVSARLRPQRLSFPPSAVFASGGDPPPPREWGPPDEGGIFPSQRPPSELDLGRRSLESEALPRSPPEFSPPEPAPTPRVLPEKAPEEGDEPGGIPSPPLPPEEPPLREPERLPWREPEPEPEPEEES